MLKLPEVQSDTSLQIPFFSAHPHLSPILARDVLARERRNKHCRYDFMTLYSDFNGFKSRALTNRV
jgi:hypothetical protein